MEMNNMFIDIIPIISHNRNVIKKLILERTKDKKSKSIILDEDKHLKVKTDDNESFICFYKVEISEYTNKLLYHYKYGKDNKHYDWENEDEIDIQIENYILSVLFSLLSYSELK